MSKIKKNTLLAIGTLILGFLLYVIFRDNTHITKLWGNADFVLELQNFFEPYSCNFFKYYFPDFLWGFALCSGLQVIYGQTRTGNVMCGCVSLLCGCLWELLQYVGMVSGTGDILDIIAYLFASVINIMMNWEEKENEKN